ncbi:MAG: metallophosphoesterase, partial [Planctomycetota bacterium JB042]
MTRPKPRRVLLVALALALIGLAYAVLVEPRRLVVRAETITPPGWPAALDRLRVVVLSDVHTGAPGMSTARLERVVERVNDARPDLVLLAGDYVIHGVVGGRFVPPDVTARLLGRIEARLGTYAVLGNHDWWQGRREVEAAFLAAGIPVLDDRARALGEGEERFWVVGVSDLWEG